jgi:hypothetical protein
MRLAGQEKMGYYPTPATLLPAIASYLTPASNAAIDPAQRPRLLDPCCGEGEALAFMAAALHAGDTWGAELSPQRAAKAAQVLSTVHACAWQHCRVGRGAVSLLWLNPPYDANTAGEGRQEQTFLEDTAHVLCAGGVLVYIVPKAALGIPAIARHLAGRYEDIHAVRFPDDEYSAYEQVIVFALRRARYAAPTDEAMDAITRWAKLLPEAMPVLTTQDAPRYRVPPAPLQDLEGRAPAFRRLYWEPEDLLAAAHAHGVRARSRAWREAVASTRDDVSLQPAMPLKRGHAAMLLASGLMGLMRLDTHGEPLLAKGRVVKTKDVQVETVVSAGGERLEKTVEKDVFLTRIATLDASGRLDVISDQAGLAAFIETHGEDLGRQVLARHTPRYAFAPESWEWDRVSWVGLNMRLPGRVEGGMLGAQKHVAIAAARTLRRHKAALLVAEQGYGKSITACGVLELLDAYPALVLCPPHLTRKWAKEIGRAIPGAVAKIVDGVERGANGRGYGVMDFVRDWRAGKLGGKAVAIVSRERAKLGSGWAPVAATRRVWDREVGEWAQVLADPDTGEVLLDDDDLPLLDTPTGWKWLAMQQRFSHTAPVKGWEVIAGETGTLRRSGRWGRRHPRTPLFTEGQGMGCLQNADGMNEDLHEGMHDGTLASAPEQRVGLRRYPIATFIHRKLKGFFKLLIGDELHQFAAARSDQAIAFHQLSRACRWTLGLTATVFGGRSTSLFHVLHRTSREMRAGYGPRDERRWSEHFGVLEVTRWGAQASATSGEVGTWSGYARDRVVVRELPGINPAVIRYLLPHTIFARIADLGYALPPYAERVVRLDMATAQAEQCWREVYDPRNDGGRLFTLMKDALKDGDNTLLSVWLQTALARPNACFRDEAVLRRNAMLTLSQSSEKNTESIDTRIVGQRRRLLRKGATRECLMTLPAIAPDDGWLPKECWLGEYCTDQARQGRKVLVYVRQTGTRDIQGRIVDALGDAGVRARMLPASLKPEHREAWVQAHTDELDALIVNPQKVDTGLDLVMFGSIVWYEVSYSLYVMWQAMRRVWRLGQTKPVEVVFLAYRDTLEDLALRLMGKKLYAAQLLYGDEIGGAIVESDDGNFLTELARAAVARAQVDDLASLFAGANGPGVMTENNMPIPELVPTVRLPATTRGVSMSDLRAFVGRSMRRTPMPAAVPETQISLFG